MSQVFLEYDSFDYLSTVTELQKLGFDFDLLKKAGDKKFDLYYSAYMNLQRAPIEYMIGRDLNDPKVIAQVIVDAIPKGTLKCIKKNGIDALRTHERLDNKKRSTF